MRAAIPQMDSALYSISISFDFVLLVNTGQARPPHHINGRQIVLAWDTASARFSLWSMRLNQRRRGKCMIPPGNCFFHVLSCRTSCGLHFWDVKLPNNDKPADAQSSKQLWTWLDVSFAHITIALVGVLAYISLFFAWYLLSPFTYFIFAVWSRNKNARFRRELCLAFVYRLFWHILLILLLFGVLTPKKNYLFHIIFVFTSSVWHQTQSPNQSTSIHNIPWFAQNSNENYEQICICRLQGVSKAHINYGSIVHCLLTSLITHLAYENFNPLSTSHDSESKCWHLKTTKFSFQRI